MVEPDGVSDNTERAHFLLGSSGYRHKICNIYCFSSATKALECVSVLRYSMYIACLVMCECIQIESLEAARPVQTFGRPATCDRTPLV